MSKVLDKEGIILALVMGILITYFGGIEYLILMLGFLFVSIMVTKYEHSIKREMGIYEHERGWENVFSNGLLPTILAVLSPWLGIVPYVASVAAVTADKFGSEVGVLSKEKPVSLGNFSEVKPGTSGAMTVMGSVASLLGSTSIAFLSIFLFQMTPTNALIIALAGFGGSVVDSIFGVFEEKGLGTKGTTNFICSVAGAIMGMIIIG